MATSESSSSAEANSSELPDLYRLLGLAPLEIDARKIEQALDLVRKKALAAKETDSKLALRATKIFSLGQKHLLDAQRKTAYDLAWKKSYGDGAATVANVSRPVETMVTTAEPAAPELTWDMSELENVLPAEDPRAAFDLAAFLQFSECLPESNPEADYDRLQGFLGGTTTSTATLAAPEAVSALTLLPELSQPKDKTLSTSKREARSETPATPATAVRIAPPTTLPKNAGSLAQQMRKKRSQSFLLSVVGMLFGVGLILGITLYLIRDNEGQTGNESLAIAEQVIAPKSANLGSGTPAIPKGSGLPKVTRLDVTGLDATGLDNPVVAVPGMAADNAPQMNSNMSPDSVPVAPPNEPPPTPVESNTQPAPAVPTPEPMVPEPTPTPTPEPPVDPVLSDEEKSEWQKAMKGVRELLGRQEFAKAQEQLAESEKAAKTAMQRQQHKRLITTARLVSEFHQSLVSAVTGMGAGETFTIGKSTPAAFVEGSATEVAIRLSGQNRTYKLTELPIGLAYGLADLRMDTAHQSSLARKAAFALVHPKSNALATKEAREMMAKAAAAGVVDADLPEVFDDDYALASP